MKPILLALTSLFTSILSPWLANAGPITAGGPMTPLYRTVCYIRITPTELPPYEVFVGFVDQDGNNQVRIEKDVDTHPTTVRELSVRQGHIQQMGEHEAYFGPDFELDIRPDQHLPGGAGLPGTFSGVIEGQPINGTAECTLFFEPNEFNGLNE